jgi:transcriptional regulator with XRE-family HTH domain
MAMTPNRTPVSSRRTHLGTLVTRRRRELGWSMQEAAQRAEVDYKTWRNVERAIGVSERSLDAVERALGWPLSSATSYLAGGPEPTVTLHLVPDVDAAQNVVFGDPVEQAIWTHYGHLPESRRWLLISAYRTNCKMLDAEA